MTAPRVLLAQASAHSLPLRDESVQCAVTSPPYWGLRQYAGEQCEVWGGDPEHAHEWGPESRKVSQPDRDSHGGFRDGARGNLPAVSSRGFDASLGAFCACGAWYGALGLEPTPDCGAAGKVRLRRDLTPAQREYVLRRLLGVALPDADSGGTTHRASRRSQRRNGGRDAQPTI